VRPAAVASSDRGNRRRTAIEDGHPAFVPFGELVTHQDINDRTVGKEERAVSNKVEMMATAIEKRPHSFQFIRKSTGLKLTDQQFTAIAKSDPARFKLVRFLKRDDEGARILPGRPGVALRDQQIA
jgi:hypothetical protein